MTHTAVQIQKALTAYFSSEQLLPFDFDAQYTLLACLPLVQKGMR